MAETRAPTPERRLFVPLSRQPYLWFRDGGKEWEIRRAKGAYSKERVTVGRPVELRLGYSGAESLFGTVSEVVVAETLEKLLFRMHWQAAIPTAGCISDAVATVRRILDEGPHKPGPFIAFRVAIDRANIDSMPALETAHG